MPPPVPVPDATAAAPPSEAQPAWSRFSVYGDVWSRVLDWGVRRCPFFLEPPILFGYAFLFFIFAARPRRAVQHNLAVVLTGSSHIANFFRAFRVFWEFAWMVADAARARSGQNVLSWELDGVAPFESLAASQEGAIVLTAHMGSYDVAAPFFAEKLGRRLTSVRVPDRQADLQAYMEKERAAQESQSFRIRYNQPGEFLGVELARALSAGEVIALQGDRVPGAVSPVRVPFHDHTLPLPRGPFVLAQAAGVPIYPLFIVRAGWRRYRIVVLPPRRIAKEQNGQSDRQAALMELALWWRDVLDEVLQHHWPRWLAFEEMFERPPPTTGT